MDGRLVVLQLFLNELVIDSDITSLAQRKTIQKSIYLAQRAGVDLGYRFGWYRLGPYSTSLTRDYYQLSDEESPSSGSIDGRVLKDSVQARLEKVKPLFDVPNNVSAKKAEWLELLASYDYLLKVQKLDDEQATKKLHEEKPLLVEHLEAARAAIDGCNELN